MFIGMLGKILSSQLYEILFGTGGVLVIIIAVVTIFVKKKKKDEQHGIYVNKSKNTSITNNELDDQSIIVEKSIETDISDNKG